MNPAVSTILEAFLTEAEGRSNTAYRDVAGVWTIGIGSTSNVMPGMVITDAEIDARFESDTSIAATGVAAHLDDHVKLTDHQTAALISFTFNEGVEAFAGSTLLREINMLNFSNIHYDLQLWNKVHIEGRLIVSRGLTNRREKEFVLWSTPDDSDTTETQDV